MKDPDSETLDPVQPQFVPARPEQLHKIEEFVSAYADMCIGVKNSDVWDELKKRFNFKGTSEISSDVADKITKQVETWYLEKKKKEAGD